MNTLMRPATGMSRLATVIATLADYADLDLDGSWKWTSFCLSFCKFGFFFFFSTNCVALWKFEKITRIQILVFGLNYSNNIWIPNYSLTSETNRETDRWQQTTSLGNREKDRQMTSDDRRMTGHMTRSGRLCVAEGFGRLALAGSRPLPPPHRLVSQR